jgi:hypothetical protein
MAVLDVTMLAGSGTAVGTVTVANVPVFCAAKLLMVEPEIFRLGSRLENEREKFSGGLPAIRATIGAKFDVKTTFCGGLEPTSDAEPPPARPLRTAFWNVVVRKFPPVPFAPEVIAIVPLYSCWIVPAEVVAVPVLTTSMKVSKASMGVARRVPPMFVILMGSEPGAAKEFVVNLVVDPEATAVIKPTGFVCPNWRIVTALLEVAIASEASDASTRERIEITFMESLLSGCGMRMLRVSL